jgi:isochorismate synthase
MSARHQNTALRKATDVDLHDILAYASHKGFAFACWKLPNDQLTHTIIDTSGRLSEGKVTLEDALPGFLVSPFHNELRNKEVFLHADLLISSTKMGHDIKVTLDPARSSHANTFLTDVGEDCDDIQGFNFESSPPEHDPANAKAIFMEFVQECISAIRQERFKKVVPSRYKDLKLSKPLDPLEQFDKIRNNYPAAFASFIFVPGLGTWLGASPEVLVSIQGDRFSTMALAGTQQLSPSQDLRDVAWTQKEIEEQAMVSRYIINCFKKIRLREFEEDGPKTMKAANLIHLLTEFEVNMKAVNFPQLGTVMTELLHPTSAVCGMPLEPAMDFLKANEHYDRQLYSGYLGPVNIKGVTELFVNLRCMRLFDKSVRAFVGAGVKDPYLKKNGLRQSINLKPC